MTAVDVHGPVDFVLLEFTGDRLTGRAADELLSLVERGIVHVYDLLVVGKDRDGAAYALDIEEAADQVGGFAQFQGARSGILADDDLRLAADAMAPGTLAALLVYENTWAVPFVAAARESGGEMIAGGRIPAQDVMDALDSLEAKETI
ncbi:MAG TPA: DUF6325 family protein [Kribbella sp.]|nr:DUF6325 family protein [Kribbella sp.]